jgi:thioredoxin 1
MEIVAYILAGIVALFILLQVAVRVSMARKKGKPAPELGGKLGKEMSKGGRTVLYFFSPQCGACKPMTPVFEKLAKSEKSIKLVNIADDMETARKFGIMGTPSVVVVEEGIIKDFRVGQMGEPQIYNLV